MERLKTYVGSKIEAQRLAHVKMIAETSITLGYELSIENIFIFFNTIAEDSNDIIRSHFATELSTLADSFLPENPSFLDTILPTTQKLLVDISDEVRSASAEIMVSIFTFVEESLLLPKILPIVLNLAHNHTSLHQRQTAVYLLNKLALVRGDKISDICIQFIVPEMSALAEDSSFQVRRAVAQNLAPSIKFGFSFLFQALRNLVADPIWGVRRACGPSLALVCRCLQEKEEKEELIPLGEALMNDPNNFVREKMEESLGSFLAELEELPESLLLRYGESIPSEGAAQTLADVAIALGKENWHRLDPLALRLSSCKDWHIESVLAEQLGKLTIVAGIDRVCEFIEQLKEDRFANWRLRFTIAEQLPSLLEIFDEDNAWNVLAPLCFGLLDDPVKVVGKAAMESLGVLFLKFDGDKKQQICQSLLERSNKRRYGYDVRQQFVWVVSALRPKLSKEDFTNKFLSPLLQLVDDPVTNVRIALARVLIQESFRNLSPEVEVVLVQLSKDTEVDVVHIAKKKVY